MTFPPPLASLKVLELAGLAPGPFAGLLLADAGASVLRIDQPTVLSHPSPTLAASVPIPSPTPDLLARRKASVALNLKSPRARALFRCLCLHADVLIDPFRPGVLERLGLGPAVLCSVNSRLIYARITGFRRTGRWSNMAGHDINYLAVAGVLSLLGRADAPPTPPMNILGDFAGGGAALVLGILLALAARERNGRGQVVEANMVDGASYLATFPRIGLKTPLGDQPRGRNLLDSGCPWYDTYQTRDGKWMAVGALEARFFKELVSGLGLDGQGWEEKRDNRTNWPELRKLFKDVFRTRTREEWTRVFESTDACCTPVLHYQELEARARSEAERERGKGEKASEVEGDQRPMVTLRDSPVLAVREESEGDPSHGQGPGVKGGGYYPSMLAPGEGGEELLKEWLGWSRGKDYEVHKGGLVAIDRSKI